jgi:hypothetical protein
VKNVVALLLTVFATFAACAQAAAHQPPLAITNINVIDATGSAAQAGMTVIIRGGATECRFGGKAASPSPIRKN